MAPLPGADLPTILCRIEKRDRRGTKNGRVRYLPDMLALGRQNTAGARQQGSRCRGRRGPGSGPMAAL